MRHFSVKAYVVPGFLLACSCNIANAEIEFGVDLGFRTDDLKWNIPGRFTGKDGKDYIQNIVSELTWKNLKSNYLNGHATFKDGEFIVRGDVGYGVINSGDNQDSDYRGNNRTEEFSRSNNKSNGDNVNDLKIGFGLNFGFLIDEITGPKLQLMPQLGLSSHVQSLLMTNGVQTVSVSEYAPSNLTPAQLGPFPGLKSTYVTQWMGPWLGLDTRYQFNDQITLRANYEYHAIDYSAYANWNLRPDLKHPKSFEHSAAGYGNVLNLGVVMALTRLVKIEFSVTSQQWRTSTGMNVFYFSDGFIGSTPLNAVTWRSQAYQIGMQILL